MAMGHVASSAPGASQMYMSVLIGSCGSSGPVITLKPLWGSPGTELSTWSIGSLSLCCIRAIQRTRIASRPLRSYTAIQRYTLYSYTSLYTIQAIQHPSASYLYPQVSTLTTRFTTTRVRGESHGIRTVDPGRSVDPGTPWTRASGHPGKQASVYSGNAAYAVDTKHMLRCRSWKT